MYFLPRSVAAEHFSPWKFVIFSKFAYFRLQKRGEAQNFEISILHEFLKKHVYFTEKKFLQPYMSEKGSFSPSKISIFIVLPLSKIGKIKSSTNFEIWSFMPFVPYQKVFQELQKERSYHSTKGGFKACLISVFLFFVIFCSLAQDFKSLI